MEINYQTDLSSFYLLIRVTGLKVVHIKADSVKLGWQLQFRRTLYKDYAIGPVEQNFYA